MTITFSTTSPAWYHLKRRLRNGRLIRAWHRRLANGAIRARVLGSGGEPVLRKVFIETCNYCNHDCSFCPISVRSNTRPRQRMDDRVYAAILRQLRDLEFRGMIALYANNEPLLDGALAERIRMARAACPAATIYLSTNGLLLEAGRVREYFAGGLNQLIIENYADDLQLLPSVRAFVADYPPGPEQIRISLRLKHEVLTRRAGTAPNATPLFRPLEQFCALPFYEMVVTWDGTVPLCCFDPLNRNVMGNVLETGIGTLWASAPFRETRARLAAGQRAALTPCRECDFRGFKSR